MFEGMDTSYGHGGFVATQDTAERRNTGRGRSGVPWIPVFTSDIHDLLPGQDSVRRGAHESSEVVIVGIVRSVERKYNSGNVDYLVDDNTGQPLVVNQMLDGEGDRGSLPIAENTYVRVIGKVRTWGNVRSVVVFSISPLKSLNELTMHILEVNYCKMFYSKDILRRHEDKAQSRMSNGGAAASSAYTGSTNAYSAMPRQVANAMPVTSGLSGINAEIHKFLNTATNEAGYSTTEIAKRFPQVSIGKIREILDLLSGEGHVYTTIDDEHYKTTDA